MIAVPETVERILLDSVSWEEYERLLESFSNRRLRHTYDAGRLEIMSPTKIHDQGKKLLARIVESAAIGLELEIQSIGSTTLRLAPLRKGLEPDEAYYIQHEAEVRYLRDYLPGRDPPPDLAIEVEYSHKLVPRLPVFAELGIPEVWHLKNDKVQILRLSRAKYIVARRSPAFPILNASILNRFIARRLESTENTAIKEFQAWLKRAAGR
jgi:Uma2 family endonuclease